MAIKAGRFLKMWVSENTPHKFYKSEYLAVVRQHFVGFFVGCFLHYLTMILCCYKWPGQVEPFRKMQRLLHSWRATKLSREGKMSENSGYSRQRNYNQKQEISSFYTDQQDIWVHTQSAVNVREQSAKPQSNGMKFRRAKCDCLGLHQLKTFFSWLRPSDKARTQLWRHMG